MMNEKMILLLKLMGEQGEPHCGPVFLQPRVSSSSLCKESDGEPNSASSFAFHESNVHAHLFFQKNMSCVFVLKSCMSHTISRSLCEGVLT